MAFGETLQETLWVPPHLGCPGSLKKIAGMLGAAKPPPPRSLGQQANSCPVLRLSAGAIATFDDYLQNQGANCRQLAGTGGL